MGQLALMIAGTLLALPPGTGRVYPLRLETGQEFIYHARYTREGDRPGAALTQLLDTYVLILDVNAQGARGVFMTEQRVDAKPGVETVPVVRIDRGRIDAMGRVTLETPSTLPRLPIELPPTLETYPFVELPEKIVAGANWNTVDAEFGPVTWTPMIFESLDNCRCLKLKNEQSSRNANQGSATVWERKETVWILEREGFVARVDRKTKWRTESGDGYNSQCIVHLEAPPNPLGSGDLRNRNVEITAAIHFRDQLAELMKPRGEPDYKGYDALLRAIDRRLDLGTPYNVAIKSIRRRAELAQQGIRPPEPIIIRAEKQTPIEIKPAPEMMLRDLESGKSLSLSSLRGRPVVLVFFKPLTDPNAEVLRYIRAASKSYAGRVEVIALLVDGTAAEARNAQLGGPVYDGRDVLGGSGSRVMVLDRAGEIRLNSPGWSSEFNKSINDALNQVLRP